MANRFDILTSSPPNFDIGGFAQTTPSGIEGLPGIEAAKAGALAVAEKIPLIKQVVLEKKPITTFIKEAVERAAEPGEFGLASVIENLAFGGLIAPQKVLAEVADTALSRLIRAVKEAKPVRKEIAALQTAERAKRAGMVTGILEKIEGEKAFIQAKGQLKGPLIPEKPRFEALRDESSIQIKTKTGETVSPVDISIQLKKEAEKISDTFKFKIGFDREQGISQVRHMQEVSKILEVGDLKALHPTDILLLESRGYKIEQIGEKLGQGDIDTLFIQIQRHPDLSVYEKISAADGFSQLLKGEIPQPSKLSLLEDVFGKELIQETLNKRPALDKLKDLATEVINIPRSLMASFDMSAPLRQGILFTLTRPKTAIKAGYEMFRQAFSEKNYIQWLNDIKKDPLYKVMKDSDLYIADPRRVSGGLAAREERFMSNLAERIPIIGKGIKVAERAYTSYLNKLRTDVFASITAKFQKMGLTTKENPDLYKSLAGFVNNATGRGDLGKLSRVAQQLNTVFFSPRLIASRFNLLNPIWYAKQPSPVRKEAIKSFAEFVGVGSTILTLAKLAGADVSIDPRSTDFGKIKIGNTRWDIWGGFQQWVRVISQLTTGERKTQKGKVIPLSKKKFPFETRLDVAERFIRGKLAPVPSLALELFEGAKLYGDEIKPTQEVIENTIPLYLQDIREAFEQLGPSALITVGAPAFFGVGVQTYEEKQKENRFNF